MGEVPRQGACAAAARACPMLSRVCRGARSCLEMLVLAALLRWQAARCTGEVIFHQQSACCLPARLRCAPSPHTRQMNRFDTEVPPRCEAGNEYPYRKR